MENSFVRWMQNHPEALLPRKERNDVETGLYIAHLYDRYVTDMEKMNIHALSPEDIFHEVLQTPTA